MAIVSLATAGLFSTVSSSIDALEVEAVDTDGGSAEVVREVELSERLWELEIDSPSVGTQRVRLILPASWDEEPGRTWPLLYLLHGQGGGYTNWTQGTGILRRLTEDLDVLIVMPDAGAGWYSDWWNTGDGGQPAWETFHIEELMGILERGWRAGDRRAIAGLSMGGFGAMSYAARHPELFSAAASYSGVVDPLGSEFFPEVSFWGDKDKNRDIREAHDPITNAAALEGMSLYRSYGDGTLEPGAAVVDGFEAWLVSHNEALIERLGDLDIPVVVDAWPGLHDWANWERAFEASLPLLLTALDGEPVRRD